MAAQGGDRAERTQREDATQLLTGTPAEARPAASGGSSPAASSHRPPTAVYDAFPPYVNYTSHYARCLPDEEKNRMLILAAQSGSLSMVRTYYNEGADVGTRGEDGRTALHWAAKGARYEMVKYLMQCGADVHARDGKRRTPLHYAAESADTYLVEYLLHKGADLDVQDESGVTPREIIMYHDDMFMTKILKYY